MASVRSPLFSLTASGTIKNLLTYSHGPGGAYVKGNRLILDEKFLFYQKKYFSQTLEQQIVRSAFKEALGAWGDLTSEEKQGYKEKAKKVQNTAIGLFIHDKFAEYYNPPAEKIDYHETLATGHVENIGDDYRINTKQLAHIVNIRRLR